MPLTTAPKDSPQWIEANKFLARHKSVKGWFNYADYYERVAALLKDGDSYAEVGVYYGRSIFYLAKALQMQHKKVKLYAVDAWKTHSTDNVKNGDDVFNSFLSDMKEFQLDITPLRADSAEAASQFADGSLEGVYIDASHDYDSVVKDIRAWVPKITSTGFIGGHDINYPPVKKAVPDTLATSFVVYKDVWHSMNPALKP